MPRRKSPPRLYLDPKRGQWVIRDGSTFVRTGCAETERRSAEKHLAEYLGEKHAPARSSDPLIADILSVYSSEHLPHTRAAANAVYQVTSLGAFWGEKPVSAVSSKLCRQYAETKSPAAARRDLETLRAAMRYWHREYGPLRSLPAVVMPAKPESRERFLTKKEAAALLVAAKRVEHLRRFILLGLYTGSRSGVMLRLTWGQIDLTVGLMRRRASGEAQDARKRTPPVRLGRRILGFLRRWHRNDKPKDADYVCTYDGEAVIKLRRSWATAVRRAQLSGQVVPHTLRHTRATWMMQAGVDPWEAAGHLGMSVEMLHRVYGHHHPDWQGKAKDT